MSSNLPLDSKYLLGLGEKIFLSPSDRVIKDCLICLEQMKDDLEILKSMDVKKESIYYLSDTIKLCYENLVNFKSDQSFLVEQKSLLESLIEDCVVSSVKVSREV